MADFFDKKSSLYKIHVHLFVDIKPIWHDFFSLNNNCFLVMFCVKNFALSLSMMFYYVLDWCLIWMLNIWYIYETSSLITCTITQRKLFWGTMIKLLFNIYSRTNFSSSRLIIRNKTRTKIRIILSLYSEMIFKWFVIVLSKNL